jgi:ABC-type dipeptide/oligopeptide/nickel transport system permease component
VRVVAGDQHADDYVRTARSKGLKERTVIFRHGLRNSIGPRCG